MNHDQKAKTEIAAAFAAARAGNIDAANAHWKTGIGLLELQANRITESVFNAGGLTPAPKKGSTNPQETTS